MFHIVGFLPGSTGLAPQHLGCWCQCWGLRSQEAGRNRCIGPCCGDAGPRESVRGTGEEGLWQLRGRLNLIDRGATQGTGDALFGVCLVVMWLWL